MTLNGEIKPDSELLDSLTSATGPLAAGAMPSLDLGGPEGIKNMCESLAGEKVAKVKAKRRGQDQPAEEVVPATLKETLSQMN